MLRRELNELLTQTGPGTPMGELFRQYWMPALLAEELPEDDCPPVRVKILSERLVAFRDSQGRYGLMDEFCAHRGASLWFGRNEEGGLRCVPGAEPEDLMRLDIPALVVPGQDASHATSAARYLEECLPLAEYWDVPVSDQTPDTAPRRVMSFLDLH